MHYPDGIEGRQDIEDLEHYVVLVLSWAEKVCVSRQEHYCIEGLCDEGDTWLPSGSAHCQPEIFEGFRSNPYLLRFGCDVWRTGG